MKNTREESADSKMTENTGRLGSSHPWKELATVNTFDREIDHHMRSTFCVNSFDGNQVREHATQQMTPFKTSVLIESLIKQLCTIFESNKVRRKKLYFAICNKLHELDLIGGSYNMMEFEALRQQYQMALYRLLTTTPLSNYPIISNRPEWSRYQCEFHEISFIASGGFGEVYKARHRLDGTEYAIKKIVVHSSRMETIMQHLREVKTLAKLNHANIVPYKAAWIESSTFVSRVSSTDRKSCESHVSEFIVESISDYSQSNKNIQSDRSSLRISDTINEHDCSSLDNEANCRSGEGTVEKNILQEYSEESTSDMVSFRNSDSNENTNSPKNDPRTADSSDSYESVGRRELCMYTSNENQQFITLYIQMALCDQTLERWMRERTNASPQPVIIAIFKQILHGIDYIHSHDIVHHDIKPSNIFISTSGQLQIHLGDFGLACPLQRETHHSVIGTHMYAAPEQLQGKCDRKSDIYSVGIVLTELLILIKTQMELSCIISRLKCGNMPEVFTVERHKWAQLIMQLIQEDPAKRPCTKELLHNLNEDKDIMITELKNDLYDKNNTIQELKEEIALLQEKVMKLSSKVSPEKVDCYI